MKVIMFTAGADPDAGQECFEAGASAFVSKLSSLDLLSTIKRLCVDRAAAGGPGTQQDRRK